MINSLLRPQGLSLVSHWELDALDSIVAARHFKKLLDLYRIDCILDVGANLGQFREFAVNAGWDGPVLSFEPVKESYEAITTKASGN